MTDLYSELFLNIIKYTQSNKTYFKDMDKIISASCPCGINCNCDPCLCGSETLVEAGPGVSLIDMHNMVPPMQKASTKAACCDCCGDVCTCVNCQCDGMKAKKSSGCCGGLKGISGCH